MKQILLQMYFGFFGCLARIYLKRHKPFIIAVTGSIGKTSARMIISEILSINLKDKKILTSSKNFNGELGMSLSVLAISDYTPTLSWVFKTFVKAMHTSIFWKKMYDIVFLEYGIDHVGEMDFLLSVAKPDIALVTKIDSVHSSQFESKDTTASEKYKLLMSTKETAFLNVDDEYAQIYSNKIKVKKYYYSTNLEHQETADIVGKNYNLWMEKEVVSHFDFSFWEKKLHVTSNLVGEENIGYINVWLVILDTLFAKYYGTSFFVKWVEKITLHFTLQYSRFSLFEGIGNSLLVDSSYNAAPESMKKVIENFVRLQKNVFPEYKIILCLGEMRELGEYAKTEHEKLANMVQNITPEIYVVGASMKEYFLPVCENAKHFENSRVLGKMLKEKLQNTSEKYLMLFKWSQNTIFMEESLKEVLAFPSDQKRICRQEEFWMKKKNNFFDKSGF